jgi:hypothetical protein
MALASVAALSTFSVVANDAELSAPAQEQTTALPEAVAQEIQNFDAVMSRFSLNPLSLKVAHMVHSIAFVKLTEKDVTVCAYNYLFGEVVTTKFDKNPTTNELKPVKSEMYTYAGSGSASCVYKGEGARKSNPTAERTMRFFGAVASPNKLNVVSFADLMRNRVPMVIQAKSANCVYDFIDTVRTQCIDNGVAVNRNISPLCSLTIEDDPLYQTVEKELWDDLSQLFSLTSPLFTEWRELVLKTRRDLLDSIQGGKDGYCLNDNDPLYMQVAGLFEKNSEFFNPKKMTLSIIKKLTSDNLGAILVTTTAIVLIHKLLYQSGKLGYQGFADGLYYGLRPGEKKKDIEAYANVCFNKADGYRKRGYNDEAEVEDEKGVNALKSIGINKS